MNNRPPLVSSKELDKDFEYLLKTVAEREAEAAKAPPVIEDQDDLDVIAEIVPKLRGAVKHIDELRNQEKRPCFDAGKIIDGWFRPLEKRMFDLQCELERRMKLYLGKKRAAEEAPRRAEAPRARG